MGTEPIMSSKILAHLTLGTKGIDARGIGLLGGDFDGERRAQP